MPLLKVCFMSYCSCSWRLLYWQHLRRMIGRGETNRSKTVQPPLPNGRGMGRVPRLSLCYR